MALLHFLLFSTLVATVAAHAAFWHPSMWGFNVTEQDFPYDNRPVSPLRDRSFSDWWFHNHLSYPPNPGDFFELPAGKPATAEIACMKAATSFHDPGADLQEGDYPCPGSPTIQFHAVDKEDVTGCAMAIAYKSDVNEVQPEDFTVFSVNHTCVWTRFTDFHVPSRMPPCPEEGCICAFFWVHSENGGGQENYMNGFRCKVTGAEANGEVKVAKSKVARRCGQDNKRGRFQPTPGNCTHGAKTPFYWLQAERNNMFEDSFGPPVYNDIYNFGDGAQDDIFEDSYIGEIPEPSPGAPLPLLRTFNSQSVPDAPVLEPSPSPAPEPSSTSPSPALPTIPPEPIPVPQKTCRRLKYPASGLEKRDESDATPGGSSVTFLGRKLYNMSRRSRRGLHPSHADRLWKLW